MSKNRIIWLDYARMIAIICVVIVHVTETVYIFNAEFLMQFSILRRLILISMFTIGRLGVPIFFFLTGYLLLDKEYSSEKYKIFLKNNFCGLLLTTVIWIVVYNIFNALFLNIPFDIEKCLKNLLFLKSTEISHMWYMPVILGIYLFIPFVANALRNTDIKILCIPLLFVFVYQFIIPDINVWLTAIGEELFTPLPDLSFSGNTYGLMILLGYLVKKGTFDKIPSLAVAILGAMGFVFTVFLQYFSDMRGITFTIWYNSAGLLLASVASFVLLSRLNLKSGKIAGKISIASFGIYLIHNLVLITLNKYYYPGISSGRRLLVMLFVVFFVTWGLVEIIEKIKPLARILIFQRNSKKA